MRDLEDQVGVPLMSRGVRGVELTAAGRAFLDHARLALTQAEAAVEAARRAAEPLKPAFALGFLTGTEVDWLAESDAHSSRSAAQHEAHHRQPVLAGLGGGADAGQARRRIHAPGAARGKPRLPARADRAARSWCSRAIIGWPRERPSICGQIVGETFITTSNTAPTLRSLIAGYLERSGLDIKPAHEVDHLAHAVSMVASTRGVMLLPAYALNFLPRAVTSRPLRGKAPTIDLVVAYNKANRSPILEALPLEAGRDRVTAPAREP